MNVRRLLESHKELDDRINMGLEEIAQLRSLAERVTQQFTDVSSHAKGGHADRVGTYAVKIADLERRIDSEIDRLVDVRDSILNVISALDSETQRNVLKRRYILHESIETIAVRLGYTARHVARLLKNGVAKLEEIYMDAQDIAS